MALIGKIRQNFWFVLIVLGLALAAFVIMDMTSATRGNTMNPTIGTINGTKINAQEFSQTESILSQNAAGQDANQRREQLWSYFVDKSIVENEVEGLGIAVPKEELLDLQFGQNLSPIIQQSFYNPNTGGIDRQQLAQVQNMISTNSAQMSDQFRQFWAVQENQIIASQLQTKLTNIVSKAVYTPSWMAEQEYKLSNTRAQVAYVKVPFDAIDNAEVEVSDADIKSYISENKQLYTNKEETRVLEYITFPVIATAKDSADLFAKMEALTVELRNTSSAEDSLKAINNGGSKPTYYYRQSELPDALTDNIADLEIGATYGPYLDNGIYSSIKLADKKVIPDSVQARIIFRQAPSTAPELVASAQTLLDSLKLEIESGRQDFDSLAMANSQDGSSALGGDLGYLIQGSLPGELDNLLFLDSPRTGRIYDVTTAAGLFLIEITDIIQRTTEDKYRLAYINAPIVPGTDTQNEVLDIVNDFLSENRTLDVLKKNGEEANYNVTTSAPLDVNAYAIGTLGADQSSRNMVRWAFDQSTEVGDVAPDFYQYQDPVQYYTNKYVIAGLKKIIPEGIQKVEDLKDELMPLVRNQKKGEMIKSAITSNDLSAVASKYSVTVDTLAAVTMNSSLIPSLGNEPNVVSSIFSVGENNVSGPVVGNSGVYLVKPIAIAAPGEASNIPTLRNSSTVQNRSKVGFSLMDALKKKADIDDGRFGYGF